MWKHFNYISNTIIRADQNCSKFSNVLSTLKPKPWDWNKYKHVEHYGGTSVPYRIILPIPEPFQVFSRHYITIVPVLFLRIFVRTWPLFSNKQVFRYKRDGMQYVRKSIKHELNYTRLASWVFFINRNPRTLGMSCGYGLEGSLGGSFGGLSPRRAAVCIISCSLVAATMLAPAMLYGSSSGIGILGRFLMSTVVRFTAYTTNAHDDGD